MRTYDEIYASAADGSPFSNSDQGMAWMANWCDRCIHDAPARRGDEGNGCPLVLAALVGKTPLEWLTPTAADHVFAEYHCIEFRNEDDGPGGHEPRPQPEDPNQGALWPRERCEGTRMLTRTPEPAAVTA